MPKIFINLITFNDNASTNECLESLEELNKKDFELFVNVVDNASNEKFESKREYKNFKLNVLYSKKNLGFSGGQNLGLRYALENNADYIVILNNDVYVGKDLIIELLNSFKDLGVGAVSPKIYFAKGYEYHKDRYSEKELGNVFWYAGGQIDWKNIFGNHRGVDEVDKGQFDKTEETEVATGCCMMVKRDVLETVGLFNENFFLYYEDADLSMRIKDKGFKILYEPKAILWHKNAAATGSGSPLQDYYITRNRLIFGFKYASVRVKLALFKESLKIFILGRAWQKAGVRDFYLKKLGSGSYIKS
ncbi:MAG: glycosyltransferase family 2 protein [Patescibacteria group bacterium]